METDIEMLHNDYVRNESLSHLIKQGPMPAKKSLSEKAAYGFTGQPVGQRDQTMFERLFGPQSLLDR
jgi:hypothetical protein